MKGLLARGRVRGGSNGSCTLSYLWISLLVCFFGGVKASAQPIDDEAVAKILGELNGYVRPASARAEEGCRAGKAIYCLMLAEYYDRGADGDGTAVPRDEERAWQLRQETCEVLRQRVPVGTSRDRLFRDQAESCWLGQTNEVLESECAGGAVAACVVLGRRYRDGQHIARDPERAAGLLSKACGTEGDPKVVGDWVGLGCHELALLTDAGVGVPKDPRAAMDLLMKACLLHDGLGQACFTACMKGQERGCQGVGLTDTSFWEAVRTFLSLPGTPERLSFLAKRQSVGWLLWLRGTHYAEIVNLPDYGQLRAEIDRRVLELALTDPNPGTRAAAVGGMDSPVMDVDLLRRIAANDPAPRVRQAAQEKLAFLTPVGSGEEWARMAESADPKSRLLAVGGLEDRAKLVKMAQQDRDRDVRAEAVQRLTDFGDTPDSVFLRIAERDKEETVRIAAASAIKDRRMLEQLLRSHRSADVREVALSHLEDGGIATSLALWVVEHDRDEGLRGRAVRLIHDQEVLWRLARSGPSEGVRVVATANLTDQKRLVEIAVQDPSEAVYRAAITTIKDESVLADVIRRRPEELILKLVMWKATDSAVLLTIAKTSREWLTRAGAVDRMSDLKAIEEIAATDPVPMVREAARRRLTALKESGRSRER